MKLLKEKIKKYVRIAILALVINLFMLFIVSDVTSSTSSYDKNKKILIFSKFRL